MVEIGSKAMQTGEVAPVKVLGVLAMIDDGELDWKVVAIKGDDELASRYGSPSHLNLCTRMTRTPVYSNMTISDSLALLLSSSLLLA